MTRASEDCDKVIQILGLIEDGSLRLIAAAAGWRNGRKLNTARVHRALMLLAASKLIWQDPGSKRWRIVTRK